jgi:hypothetical protein
MQKYKQTLPAMLLVAGVLLLSFSIVLAQPNNSYDLTWWTVDGGGDTATGGGFTLSGTIGQPEPGPVSTGGGFTLTSGFWPGGISSFSDLFLPLILR